MAFWEGLAVRDEIYNAILRGENINKTIKPEDIIILMKDGTYRLYFVDLFIRKAHKNIPVRRLLVRDFLAFLLDAAEQGIFFDRIAANITGVAIKHECQGLGFRKITDHKVHKYYERNQLVPAEIHELIIGPDAQRLFAFEPRLAELYEKKGLYTRPPS